MPLDRTVGPYFDHSGNFNRRVARWTGPTSYATGGEDVSPSVFGMGTIVALLVSDAFDGTNTRLVVWNVTTQKMQWFVPNTNAEVANATNLSAFTTSFEVIGV